MFLDHFRVNHQTVHHIQAKIQDAVHCQEAFRNRKPFIGRIVQGTNMDGYSQAYLSGAEAARYTLKDMKEGR